VPAPGSLDRFGQAVNWFFVGMMLLSGAVYFANGIRYDTTSAGALLLASRPCAQATSDHARSADIEQ